MSKYTIDLSKLPLFNVVIKIYSGDNYQARIFILILKLIQINSCRPDLPLPILFHKYQLHNFLSQNVWIRFGTFMLDLSLETNINYFLILELSRQSWTEFANTGIMVHTEPLLEQTHSTHRLNFICFYKQKSRDIFLSAKQIT